MAISADESVGVRNTLPGTLVHEDHASQVFKVDLVDDAGVRGYDSQISETGLAPSEKRIAFFIPLEFEKCVHVERLACAEFIDLNRMVDHEFHRLKRIDQGGITTKLLHGVAHGGEIDHAGYSGEILQKDAAGRERDFFFRLRLAVPSSKRAHFFLGHVAAIFCAE